MKKLNITLLGLGLAFLAYLVWQVGPEELGKQVKAVGWGIVPLILSEGFANLLHTHAWRHCLSKEGRRVSTFRLFRMELAGFAVNYLLPAASVGGEASRAALLASERPGSEAVSSVLLDKLSTAIAHLALALVGAVFVLFYARLPGQLLVAMAITTVLLAIGMGGFLLIQRHGKLGALLRWLSERRIGGELAVKASRHISKVDDELKRFFRERPRDFGFSILWHLLGHAVAILQAWLFLWCLGQPASFAKVACAGFLSLWFDLLTFAIPLNLGALEGSRIVALKAIGGTAPTGMAFGLSIRITQIFWALAGLCCYGWFALRKQDGFRSAAAVSVPGVGHRAAE